MTDAERVRYGEQAKRALADFLAPAFAVVEADYAEKMIEAAASSNPRAPDVIARLANGVQVARQVRAQIEALVLDGELVKAQMIKAENIGQMSKPKQRLLKVGQH